MLKLNLPMALISLVAGALIGYAFAALGCTALLSVNAGIEAGILLVFGSTISVRDYPRVSVALKAAALTFLAVMLIADVLLGVFDAGQNLLIIINGLILLLAAATLYKVGLTRVSKYMQR